MRRHLTGAVIFLTLLLGQGILASAQCTKTTTRGPCGDPGCTCWSYTLDCPGVSVCTMSGGFCDYGHVTIMWSTDMICDPPT